MKLEPTIDLDKVARATPGFSGAAIAQLLNEAAINAVRHNRDAIGLEDLEEARDKVLMGKQSKSMVQRPEDLKVTAYHEAGHALLVILQPECSRVLHKVTIAPRGSALGFAAYMEEHDRYSYSKEELEADIVVTLGGRVGEFLGAGKSFSGVTSDLRHATENARRMVQYYGMSDKLGLLAYENHFSQQTMREVEQEVKAVVDRCYDKAMMLLTQNRDKLELLTNSLLEKETLSAEEVYELLGMTPRALHKLD
jgi:cell division protease FtsH